MKLADGLAAMTTTTPAPQPSRRGGAPGSDSSDSSAPAPGGDGAAAQRSGMKRPGPCHDEPHSFAELAEEKRARIAQLEQTLANIEQAVDACQHNALAQAVCYGALQAKTTHTRQKKQEQNDVADLRRLQMVMVWEVLVSEMVTEVAFEVHRSFATAEGV